MYCSNVASCIALCCCLIPLQEASPANKGRFKRQDNGDGTCTQARPGLVLFGGPREVLESVSIEDCTAQCVAKKTPFECKAAVYFANDKECLFYDFNGEEPDRQDQVLKSPPADATSLIEIKEAGTCEGEPDEVETPEGGDSNPQCCEWAKKGECKRNRFWMRPNCQKSCGTPGATMRTAGGMKDNIPEECKGDDQTSGSSTRNCPDESPRCTIWAILGECQKNPYWMRPFCQNSCNSCGTNFVDAGGQLPDEEPGCPNEHRLCNFWTFMRECPRNPKYMRKHCCHGCKHEEQIQSIS